MRLNRRPAGYSRGLRFLQDVMPLYCAAKKLRTLSTYLLALPLALALWGCAATGGAGGALLGYGLTGNARGAAMGAGAGILAGSLFDAGIVRPGPYPHYYGSYPGRWVYVPGHWDPYGRWVPPQRYWVSY